jgi:nanoRNase/pAp phosphatase (c-di-AMP/oligoRNAs hydrolase)
MVSRLVLGCGTVGHAILDRLAEWTTSGELRVVVTDESRATALRDENVDAVAGHPTDESTYPVSAVAVLVAGDDPATNRAAAERARERFPDATITAYTGVGADAETRAAIEAVADRVVDRDAAMVERALSLATGEGAERTVGLVQTLRSIDGPLAVVAHDNPDPDAIASAIALTRIARSVGLAAEACYFGDISHQENRALVNLLDLDLRRLSGPEDAADYAGVALVDHSRPGVNDGLPTDTAVDIVVDHHPPRGPVDARFLDLRTGVGSTSTMLADYLDRLGIEPDRTTATALLYGIRVDTRDFTREVSSRDFEAAAALFPFVDTAVLERVEDPSMGAEVLETTARAIRNREVDDGVLATGVGRIRDRDALAQAADRLLAMEGVSVVLVHGILDDTIYASGRTRGAGVDIGETLRDAFGQIGSAGGHADMAGAQIPLGIWADVDEALDETLASAVTENINGRFFETLSAMRRPVGPDDEVDPMSLEGEE